MFYDYHTHTSFSDDCEVPMKTMIESATSLGMKEIAITDHFDPGYPDPDFPFLLDFENYQKALLEVSSFYKDKIKIVKGLEIGIMNGYYDQCKRVVEDFPYDFIIGSFHCYKQLDLYTLDYEKTNKKALLRDFYEFVATSLKEYNEYDIIGHFSIIDRYIGELFDYAPCMDAIEDGLKTIISNNKGLEINTSSFKYNTGTWLPRKEILKLYKELGGEILTIGSDSHDPTHFLDHFEDAKEMAKSIGFRYRCTFEKRKPSFIPL